MHRAPWAWSLAIVSTCALTGCREAAQRAVLQPADASAGAASLKELAASYKSAHCQKDLARVRNLDLSLCQLQSWVATPGRQRAAVEGLFELQLEEVRLELMPPDAPAGGAVMYLRQAPQGHPVFDCCMSGQERCGKLMLVGRTSRAAIHLDPGLVVVRAQGRYFLDLSLLIAEDAAHAVRSGDIPRYRPIPLGTDLQEASRMTGRGKTWEDANRALDEMQAAGAHLPGR